MPDLMRIEARFRSGITTVEVLIRHPMQPGERNPRTGELIGAHFIQEITAEYEGRPVLHALWGPRMSVDPCLTFKFRGGSPGETVTIRWIDNEGRSDTVTEPIE